MVRNTGKLGTQKLKRKRERNFGKYREGSVFQEGTLTKEGKVEFQLGGKGSKTVIEERKPDFQPLDPFIKENLPKAQGSEFKLLTKIKERRDRRKAIIDREETQFLIDVANPRPDRTTLGRIAEVGLTSATEKQLLPINLDKLIDPSKEKIKQMSETKEGKVLGITELGITTAAGIAAGTTLTKVTKASQIGKAADIHPSIISKFATNKKSIGLTKKLLSKLKISPKTIGLLVGALGTYPFAGFIKEEASQTIGIGFFQAERNNDLEGMAEAIERQQEIVDAEKTIIDWIPLLNVTKQLKNFFKSIKIKLESDKRIFAKKVIELEGGN